MHARHSRFPRHEPARTGFADGRARPAGALRLNIDAFDGHETLSQYIELMERAAARWRTRHRRFNADNLQARDDDVSP